MATKKTNASKKANSSEKSATNSSRKAATDNTAKNAAMSKPEVVETVDCVDLTILSKDTEIGLGETRAGQLRKRGRYDYLFTEGGLKEPEERPWERQKVLAEERPYARISTNVHGTTAHIYIPEKNFEDSEDLSEMFMETMERLCLQLRQRKTRAIIRKLDRERRQYMNGKSKRV